MFFVPSKTTENFRITQAIACSTNWNFCYICKFMRIIAKSTLKTCWQINPDSKTGLLAWYEKMSNTDYSTPQEVISDFKGADFVGNERIVFNIVRNKYRLVVAFNYEFKTCWVKFVGTHKAYDKIDVKTVEQY